MGSGLAVRSGVSDANNEDDDDDDEIDEDNTAAATTGDSCG